MWMEEEFWLLVLKTLKPIVPMGLTLQPKQSAAFKNAQCLYRWACQFPPSETACFLLACTTSCHLIFQQSQWGLPGTTQPLKAFRMSLASIMSYHPLLLHALVRLVGYAFVSFLFFLYCHFRRILESDQEKMHVFHLPVSDQKGCHWALQHGHQHLVPIVHHHLLT